MTSDDVIRDLARQSGQGFEPEPTMVLADALLETDRPDLGEDLVLILSGRLPFPREQRGEPFVTLYGRSLSRERALKVVFRRIHRRFAWSKYDEEERRRGLRELNEIEKNWNAASDQEHGSEMASAIDSLEADTRLEFAADSTLYERATWLLDGVMGRGPQILAGEIVDAPLSRNTDREVQLFRLVLAFDNLLPFIPAVEVWANLTTRAKRHATDAIREVLVENGGEIHEQRTSRARARRSRE